MNKDVMFSSKTGEWATPDDLFDALNREFLFTLDAAADETNHKCQRYFDKATNGLTQNWGGETVFCNPPYGRQIGKWVSKAFDEAKAGALVVMLIPARTDTAWFHDYILEKAEVRFIRGRIKFGGCKNSAPFPSMVVIYRPF